MKITEKAPAKINLILRVFERRADGYHRIETVMQKLKLCDDVAIEVASGSGIQARVIGHPELDGDNNLAAKAARAYLETADLSKKISIEITKRVFIAAGLGGGSSDGAAVLRGLENEFHALGPERLMQVAASLGSDIPFFISPAELGLGLGRGEEIISWPSLPARHVVLVNPGFAVSTPDMYRALERPLTWPEANDPSLRLAGAPKNWSDLKGLLKFRNDLQEVAERAHPKIAKIRSELEKCGADIVQMSGSGGTVFGLFESLEAAEAAEKEMRNHYPVVLTTTGV